MRKGKTRKTRTRNSRTRKNKTRTRTKGGSNSNVEGNSNAQGNSHAQGNPQEIIGINYIQQCIIPDFYTEDNPDCKPKDIHEKISIQEIKVKVKKTFTSSYELFNIKKYTFVHFNDYMLAKLRTDTNTKSDTKSDKQIVYKNITSVKSTKNVMYESPEYTFGPP